MLATTGTLAFWSWWHHWAWPLTVLLVFAHGMCSHFYINGMHELGHGTVFRTKVLNAFFVRLVSFMSWVNFEMFDASHQRHHRHTLHPPRRPGGRAAREAAGETLFEQGFVNYKGWWWTMKYTVRIARGRMETPWSSCAFRRRRRSCAGRP